MRPITFALLFLTLGSSAGYAQSSSSSFLVPRVQASVGYHYTNANAPPANCNCFGMNGGYAAVDVHARRWLGVAGRFTGSHADNISLLGQNLTLLTFTAGPRIALPAHRLAPFAQFLVGAAHGSDSYFPDGASSKTAATSFAYTAGGGVDVNLSHRFAVRAVDVGFLRTAFPNGTNNRQNHLTVGAGIVMKFGQRPR